MPTAAGLAQALTPSLVTVLHAGEDRHVAALEFLEPDPAVAVEPGDLVLAVGLGDADQVAALLGQALAGAGLVVRHGLADEPVLARCRAAGLTVLALAEGAAWSAVLPLLRTAVEQGSRPETLGTGGTVAGDLFAMADTVSAIVGGPVTIEDAHSRVLAYSTGQHDIDAARLSTIVGRRVPREVREHFRSTGVFRRLLRSDEPFLVPEGPPGVRPRFVVPVRAGGEWLGSIWAVVDHAPEEARLRELRVAADVLALHLLRARAQSELSEQLHAEQLRSVLRGTSTALPSWLGRGPWRAVALGGPADTVSVETRRLLWSALCHRHGWRGALLTQVDDQLLAVVADDGTTQPGSWPWLAALVTSERAADGALLATAGARGSSAETLASSCRQALEQLSLGADALGGPVSTAEDCWPAVTLRRALAGLAGSTHPDPVSALAEHDAARGTLVPTLRAVLEHWGEPARAARALGVHPNSVRYRMARVRELVDLDLDHPEQRLAALLHAVRLTGG